MLVDPGVSICRSQHMSSQLAASGVAEVIMLSSHDMNLRKPTAIGDPN